MTTEKEYKNTLDFVMSEHVPCEAVNQAYLAYYALQDAAEGPDFPYPVYLELIRQLATHFNLIHEAESRGITPAHLTAIFSTSAQQYKKLHPERYAKFREECVPAFTITRIPLPKPGMN